jgi:hypothetical protein
MATLLVNSVINIIQSFSKEDMEAFMIEFYKLQKPVEYKPKKQSKLNMPDPAVLAQQILAKHRAKSIPAQGKLA